MRLLDGSGVNQEVYASFCERLGLLFPLPTHPLFHVVKNGCRGEALQLGNVAKLELALALYLVVSWRLARLRGQPSKAPGSAGGLLLILNVGKE